MTTPDLPYTNDDLRAEAARQLATLTEDPDYTGVGEGMQDTVVESTDDGTCSRKTWHELLVPGAPNDEYEAYQAAQRKIHDLIRGAAEISEWAVNLGADGLEPTGNVLGVEASETPLVRVHLAFHPDMDDAARAQFSLRLGRLMADI